MLDIIYYHEMQTKVEGIAQELSKHMGGPG